MNKYKIQYWLYAMLNKKYGKDLKFKRDSLHRVYAVNRHGFYVDGHNFGNKEIRDFLEKTLQESNFRNDNGYFLKSFNCGKKDKRFAIAIRDEKRYMEKKSHLYISIY